MAAPDGGVAAPGGGLSGLLGAYQRHAFLGGPSSIVGAPGRRPPECTGRYTLELGGTPRNVCRLVPLRRTPHLHPEDWRLVFDGYRDQLEISSASKDFVFLFPGSEAEGCAQLGNPASLAATQAVLVEVVRVFLYHERYRKLHQTLTIMYPLVVALPSLYPAPAHFLPALVSALLYSNGMAATGALQQPFYVELVTGMSVRELGLDCTAIGQGLQDVRGRLQLRFPKAQHIFRIYPVVGAMPLQANNWRALYEGVSDTLDLPMAVKGFIFVCDLMFQELQPKVYFESLITGVILFLNRHRGSQAEMTTTYPLVVPLGTSLRPDVPPLDAITRAFAGFWSAPIPTASLQPSMPHAAAQAAALPPPSNDISVALAQALHARGGLLATTAPTPAAAAAAAAFQRAAGGGGFVPPVNPAPLPFATAAAAASSSSAALPSSLPHGTVWSTSAAPAGPPSAPGAPIAPASAAGKGPGIGGLESIAGGVGGLLPGTGPMRASAQLSLIDTRASGPNGIELEPPPPTSRPAAAQPQTQPPLVDLTEEPAGAAAAAAAAAAAPAGTASVQGEGDRKPAAAAAGTKPASGEEQRQEEQQQLQQQPQQEEVSVSTESAAAAAAPAESGGRPSLGSTAGASASSVSSGGGASARGTRPRKRNRTAAAGGRAGVGVDVAVGTHGDDGLGGGAGDERDWERMGGSKAAREVERRVQARMAQLELRHQEEVRAVKRQYEERIDKLERALLPPTPPRAGAGSKSRGKGGSGLSSSAAALAVAGGPAANNEAAALILSAREMANSKVEELQEELEYAEQMFHDLSVHNNALTTELNEAKHLLVKAGALEFPDVLPVHVFCEATNEEVRGALIKDGKSTKGLMRAADYVDLKIRDAGFDPFKREGGEVIGVDESHPVLEELRAEYGPAIAALVIEKKKEVERYCPSGHYPTPVLFHEGRELRLPEAVTRLVDGLREARERIRALEKIVPQRRGALYLGDDASLRHPYRALAGFRGPRSNSSSTGAAAASGQQERAPSSSSSAAAAAEEEPPPEVLSDGFQQRFEQWLTTTRGAAQPTSAVEARRLIAAAQRTFGRVFSRRRLGAGGGASGGGSSGSLAQSATGTTACLRTDEDVRAFIARQSEAFTQELSSLQQRRGGQQLQMAQWAWNLLLDYLASGASARPAGATSAESLAKLKVKEGKDPQQPPQRRRGGGSRAPAAAEEEWGGSDADGEGEGEGTPLSPGSAHKNKAISAGLRRAFVGWLEGNRRVSPQSAHGYCTSVDQIMVMVMQNGGGPGKEVAALQDVKDGERFVRDFSAAMDARLEGRNRKYHAGWRHFLDFVQGTTTTTITTTTTTTLAPRRGGGGASSASQGGDEDDEGQQHGKEEEAEQALSRRQLSAESAASAAASSSSAAAGLAPSAASLLQAAEGKMVICDAVRLQYQERVAASAKDAPATPEECFALVKAIVCPLLRRSRGGVRVRCIRSLQEARNLTERKAKTLSKSLQAFKGHTGARWAWALFVEMLEATATDGQVGGSDGDDSDEGDSSESEAEAPAPAAAVAAAASTKRALPPPLPVVPPPAASKPNNPVPPSSAASAAPAAPAASVAAVAAAKEEWDRGMGPALRTRFEGYLQGQKGCHSGLAKTYAGVVDRGLLIMLKERAAALAAAKRRAARGVARNAHGVLMRRRRTRSVSSSGSGNDGVMLYEEDEEDENGEEGAFAAVVAVAAMEKGRKRLPHGPLQTRAQFTAFVEQGLASGLVDRYEAQAAKPFNTAWRHALTFAREAPGAVEGDDAEQEEEVEEEEVEEEEAEEEEEEAAAAAAAAAAAGVEELDDGESSSSSSSDEEGEDGEAKKEGPPAFRKGFQQWVQGRRQVNRNTVRTYCRGVERIIRHVLHRLAAANTTQPPPQPPSTAEDARALLVREEKTFALVVGGVSKGVRVAWRHFMDHLGLDAEGFNAALPEPPVKPPPVVIATRAPAPAPKPAAAAASALAKSAAGAAKGKGAGNGKGEEEDDDGPSPSRQTLHHQGAAGGGLSDHIRDAFVVWLTEGRGFGRATAELTCQVVSGQLMAVMAGGKSSEGAGGDGARPRFLKDLADVRTFVKERAGAVPAFRRRGAGHGGDGWHEFLQFVREQGGDPDDDMLDALSASAHASAAAGRGTGAGGKKKAAKSDKPEEAAPSASDAAAAAVTQEGGGALVAVTVVAAEDDALGEMEEGRLPPSSSSSDTAVGQKRGREGEGEEEGASVVSAADAEPAAGGKRQRMGFEGEGSDASLPAVAAVDFVLPVPTASASAALTVSVAAAKEGKQEEKVQGEEAPPPPTPPSVEEGEEGVLVATEAFPPVPVLEEGAAAVAAGEDGAAAAAAAAAVAPVAEAEGAGVGDGGQKEGDGQQQQAAVEAVAPPLADMV